MFKRGDPVTERGVWLRATMWEPGEQQSVLQMEDYVLHGISKFHVAITRDIISWEEFQRTRGHAVEPDPKAFRYLKPDTEDYNVYVPPSRLVPITEEELTLKEWYS